MSSHCFCNHHLIFFKDDAVYDLYCSNLHHFALIGWFVGHKLLNSDKTHEKWENGSSRQNHIFMHLPITDKKMTFPCPLCNMVYINLFSHDFIFNELSYLNVVLCVKSASSPYGLVTPYKAVLQYPIPTLKVKQNRRTEGCSKLKKSRNMTKSGVNGLNIRTNGTGTSVRRSKRPLLTSRTRCKFSMGTFRNLVIMSKSVIRSCSVTYHLRKLQ